MYTVLCEFYRESKTWRVYSCSKEPAAGKVSIGSEVVGSTRLLRIPSERRLVAGSYINPRKVLGIPRKPDIKERVSFKATTTAAGLTTVTQSCDLKKLSLKALYALHAVLEREIASRNVDDPFFRWMRMLDRKGVFSLVSDNWKTHQQFGIKEIQHDSDIR